MTLLKGYPDGSDLTLINNWYRFPKKNEATEKWDEGSMTVVYRDNTTNKKHTECIKNPKCEFYMLKEDAKIRDYNELFRDMNDLDKVTCPYKDQTMKIAELTGNLEYYKQNLYNGRREDNKMLHTLPNVFNSDYNIEDHWRYLFDCAYTNDISQAPTKAFFDIEADIEHCLGDFVQPGECPINAITIINESINRIDTLLLRNPTNPQIQQFEDAVNAGLMDGQIKAFVKEQVGGWKNEIRFGLDKINYNFHFFDEEIILIDTLFQIINNFQPDFVLAWNMAFDIPYIIARIKALGYKPEDIMCHEDFKEKVVKYYVDERNQNEYAERGDFATIASYSVFLDQMIQFASRRKGQSAFKSFKLDDIGEQIAGVNKYDYHYITTDLAQLPRANYQIFVFYNIVDTIVQKCIEKRVGDIDYIFNKCAMYNTRYSKGHRQTVFLTNKGIKSFATDNGENHYAMGNNVNKYKEKGPGFSGAFVADSTKVSNYARRYINGQPVQLFDNLDDYDYTALYPSVMRQFNMAPNTQIGYIQISKPVFENENRYKIDRFDRAGTFLEDLQCHGYIEFASKWFHLADYKQLWKDVQEYYTMVCRHHGVPLPYNSTTGLFTAMIFGKPESINPLIFDNSGIPIKPMIFYRKLQKCEV